MIQAIIIEDEKPAQEVLLNYIEKTPFIECLGIYESGLDVPHSKLKKANLLFLDIELPALNGMTYLKTIEHPPLVIVTTAYTDFAIDAFEQNVLDYLVKPYPYERFFKAVNRVRNNLLHQQKEINKNLFLYANKTLYKVNIDDVLYLKAEVDYVKVVTADQDLLILDSLRNWLEKLQGLPFMQIHRSYIINIDKITKIYGNQAFIRETAIPIGKTYKDAFLDDIKQ